MPALTTIAHKTSSVEGGEILWRSAQSWVDYIEQPRTAPPIASADHVMEPYINQGGFDAIVTNHHRQLQKKKTTRHRRELRQTYAGWGRRDIADRSPSPQGITQFLDPHARINAPTESKGPPTRGIWHNEIRRISISNSDDDPPPSPPKT